MWRDGDALYRLAQDCSTDYGVAVVVRRVVLLLGREGTGWRRYGMHHIDAHRLPSGDRWSP